MKQLVARVDLALHDRTGPRLGAGAAGRPLGSVPLSVGGGVASGDLDGVLPVAFGAVDEGWTNGFLPGDLEDVSELVVGVLFPMIGQWWESMFLHMNSKIN